MKKSLEDLQLSFDFIKLGHMSSLVSTKIKGSPFEPRDKTHMIQAVTDRPDRQVRVPSRH